jgi:NAD+ diphosphatase
MYTPAGFIPAHALPPALPDTALAFAYAGDKLVVTGDDEHPSVPLHGELAAARLAGRCHYLGELAATPCVAIALGDDTVLPAGFRSTGLRALFFRLPDPLVALAARAFQIVDWDRTHRYCGRCGTPTQDKPDERARECPACGLVAYPRVSPAMMALITRGSEMLLARAHRFPPAVFSALAGFVEPGETIEDCIRREVREEVGIEVDAIRYFASQAWAFPHSLMIAFTAEYAGGEIRLDDREIAEARWFSVDTMPTLPSSLSIARQLIDATAARLREAHGNAAR